MDKICNIRCSRITYYPDFIPEHLIATLALYNSRYCWGRLDHPEFIWKDK